MRRFTILLLFLLSSFLVVAQETKEDVEFKKEMAVFKEKLKHVKTGPEGLAILNQMQARQQEYLKSKTAPVTKIRSEMGVDQVTAAALAMRDKKGNAKYENNPLYTKCKVEVSFSHENTSSEHNSIEQTEGQSRYSSSGTITMRTYLFKYAGQIALTGGGDAIIECKAGGSISASGTDHSPQSHSSYTENASAVQFPQPSVSLAYNTKAGTWNAGAKVNYEGIRMDGQGSTPEKPDDYANATNDDSKLTMVNNVITLTSTINEHTESKPASPNHQQSNNITTLTIKITPDEPEKYIAYFEPVGGQQSYEQWMPEGYEHNRGIKNRVESHGNYIDIKIKVEDPSHPGVDRTNQIRYISWELPEDDVSNIPGYANNAPTEFVDFAKNPNKGDPISALADMQLRLTTELSDTTVENLRDTSTAKNNYTIRVYSFDWGGFAKLVAHIVLTDGTKITAKERGTGTEFLLLPKRSGDLKTATVFKKNNVLDKKDDADDEKLDEKDKYPGDGFSLFEEYRGFMENGKHFRGDPNAKDVMVYNGIGTFRCEDGIKTYEHLMNNYTGKVLKTHYKFTFEEFGLKTRRVPDDEWTKSLKYGVSPPLFTSCLNYNFLNEAHIVDQHGIVILGTQKSLGFAAAIIKDGKIIGPPDNYYYLIISADFSPDPDGYVTVRGTLDNNGEVVVDPIGNSLITTDEYAITVAHEMMHYSGVSHHGDNQDYYAGEGDPMGALKRSSFTYDGHGSWIVNAKAVVKLYWEQTPNTPITDLDPKFAFLLHQGRNRLMIRTWKGTCSGEEDCIMRYDDAQVYCKDKNSLKMYVVGSGGYLGDLTGMKMCKSPTGTGVNDAHHLPMSRYGDADAGRGDCYHQFCINDKYATP